MYKIKNALHKWQPEHIVQLEQWINDLVMEPRVISKDSTILTGSMQPCSCVRRTGGSVDAASGSTVSLWLSTEVRGSAAPGTWRTRTTRSLATYASLATPGHNKCSSQSSFIHNTVYRKIFNYSEIVSNWTFC